jgi:hypothetical protein
MHLALVLRERQASGAVGQPPLPGVVIDRKADKFDERRAGTALRIIFVVWPWRRPYAREVYLRKQWDVPAQDSKQRQ